MRKHIRDAVSALEHMGCQDVTVDDTRTHPRIHFVYDGTKAFITTSNSPRTNHSADWAIQDARRVLGLPSNPPGRPKRKRRKVKVERPAEHPGPITTFDNPFEQLEDHAQFPAVKRMRVRQYFEQVWAKTCCQLFNAPSVRESLTQAGEARSDDPPMV